MTTNSKTAKKPRSSAKKGKAQASGKRPTIAGLKAELDELAGRLAEIEARQSAVVDVINAGGPYLSEQQEKVAALNALDA